MPQEEVFKPSEKRFYAFVFLIGILGIVALIETIKKVENDNQRYVDFYRETTCPVFNCTQVLYVDGKIYWYKKVLYSLNGTDCANSYQYKEETPGCPTQIACYYYADDACDTLSVQSFSEYSDWGIFACWVVVGVLSVLLFCILLDIVRRCYILKKQHANKQQAIKQANEDLQTGMVALIDINNPPDP